MSVREVDMPVGWVGNAGKSVRIGGIQGEKEMNEKDHNKKEAYPKLEKVGGEGHNLPVFHHGFGLYRHQALHRKHRCGRRVRYRQ
jgi:hypothetical protein